jgi:hypothetical protein
MSQVEALSDNVTEIAAAPPSMAMAAPPTMAADPEATEHTAKETKTPKTPAPANNIADSRWPRWPNAWPDGSRQS